MVIQNDTLSLAHGKISSKHSEYHDGSGIHATDRILDV